MSMREQMARAMHAGFWKSHLDIADLHHIRPLSAAVATWESMGDGGRSDWMAAADAALGRLSTPTPSMQDAMERIDIRSVSTGRPHVEFVWQAGIDAAKEGK